VRSDPEVTTTSSTRGVFTEVGEAKKPPNGDPDMGAAIRSDLRTIKETFALKEVPREAYVLGFAGLIPYLATSMGTVYCAWDVNYAHHHGTGFFLSEDSAIWLLSYLEPLQVGYGAVIISFLGAIHWGLEWAKYGGTHGYRRYATGVIAPAIAWPTVLFPYEYALISQFLAFTYLYYADTSAMTRGWAPPWYGTYRFVLTALSGAAIVISLIGRGEVDDRLERNKFGIHVPDSQTKRRSEHEGEEKLAEYEREKAKIMDAKKEQRLKAKEAEEERKREEEDAARAKEKEGEESDDSK